MKEWNNCLLFEERTQSYNPFLMEGINLISLSLRNNSINKNWTHYKFCEEDYINNKSNISDIPYSTVIIGPNGTGKSSLLRKIVDIFNDLHNTKLELNKNGGKNIASRSIGKEDIKIDFSIQEDFHLIYLFRGFLYSIKRAGQNIIAEKNGLEIQFKNISLPKKLVAACYGLSDKFPLKKQKTIHSSTIESKGNTRYDNDFYEYLGSRSANNMISSFGLIGRTLDLVFDLFASGDRKSKDKIEYIFNYLGYIPKISIHYRFHAVTKALFRAKNLFDDGLTTEDFKKILEQDIVDSKRISFSRNTYDKLIKDDELLIEVVSYFNRIANSSANPGKKTQIFEFDFSKNRSSNAGMYRFLNILRKLDILSYNSINVSKIDGHTFDWKDSSSGEIHIITSLLSLSAVVEDNSIVLIDEPEISLHPNWQMKYIDLINTVFNGYNNCHFIIATHSHFLISYLKQGSSSIVALRYEEDMQVTSEVLKMNTYGWSAEDILYNVFKVRTVRNHYFEADIRQLLGLISANSKSKKPIHQLITKLKLYVHGDTDPLHKIIIDAETYLKKLSK